MKQEYDFSKGERGKFYRENARLTLPTSHREPDWSGPGSPLGLFIRKEAEKTLDSYRAQPALVTEHANLEHDTAHGGYAHRQLFELVQNSADALIDAPKGKSILIRLTDDFLYCADDGSPVDRAGIRGLMFSHMSSKRNSDAIGRFGLGFKSVLGVSDSPEFYSRPGSFRFDRTRAGRRIEGIAPGEERYPVLRLPESIDPCEEERKDKDLRELMRWATNIVRLPLETGARDDLAQQIREFPPEFLLFVDHVRYLTLENRELSRSFILQNSRDELRLDTGKEVTRWRRFERTHRLSEKASSDRRSLDDADDISIRWAVPLDRLTGSGQFWAFFPTKTASLVAGILNAPWKTNEDRQNLLPGPYNDELIGVAAEMIADGLPDLATQADPAGHLDALPRRHEAGDPEHSVLLRDRLYSCLREREIVPNQGGTLRAIEEIRYPPKALTDGAGRELFDQWAAYPGRPSNWLHHNALTRNRLARIDWLFPSPRFGAVSSAPRATIAEWLEALAKTEGADDPVRASMAAVQVAARIPERIRTDNDLGEIVLTAAGAMSRPNPEYFFLPAEKQDGDGSASTASFVHPDLASDDATLSALKVLGLMWPSPESAFRRIAKRVLQDGKEPASDQLENFWVTSRTLTVEDAAHIVREVASNGGDWQRREIWTTALRVRTVAGSWRPLRSVLLPGDIVPGDGSRDADVAVDTGFHGPDEELLCELGAAKAPRDNCDMSMEPGIEPYRTAWRRRYYELDDLPHRPQWGYLDFRSFKGAGPLEFLAVLSCEGRSLYTNALLRLDSSYEQWTMQHTGLNRRAYPTMSCESFTIHMLHEYGVIRVSRAFVPLADGLGPHPKSPEALRALLIHPAADKIKKVFNLAEPAPEFYGEEEPIPLIDIWPGLEQYLPPHRKACRLIRCERILVIGESRECVFHAPDVYVATVPDDDERRELQFVANELELGLDCGEIEAILQRRMPSEIQEQRNIVAQCSSDAERLLAAVGEQGLRRHLPDSLLAVLEGDGAALTGVDVAEAAIATWHTDALKQFKWALDRLDPPSQFAGSARAVRFVRSLGFSPEWAGQRGRKRDPFLEVEGYSLPPLHCYQRIIADNVREMLRGELGDGAGRRGMIAMPTGSGKTRVAVQAVVEAMRVDGFRGGVLWVADRDELCEQAVEAWRQVWSSVGVQAARLLISRMWGGQPKPLPTSELHVVVATVQTLDARLSNRPDEYGFLADFRLVVFDEAHRSVAPTFTSVMQDIGLTRVRKADEPFLIGLTATPYRGHDERETARLVNRYGRRRLDSGAFGSDDPEAVIGKLQSMGVLAQADHETIEGETFSVDAFSPEELERARSLPWLPQSIEDRIARSSQRTRRIIEAYRTHIDPDWPTLIFATSVEHAQTVAALLNRREIPSRAVSGTTESATRRRVVEEFRRGGIKALVNYGVFSEGFDAPKTRAIVVARPVYSPNLYFQMIGRGLRGPLNGGDDRCLILNVLDNIENFDRNLAFSELDWLWA